MTRPLKIAVVAGEESGDLLGANLIESLKAIAGRDVEIVGVGGRHLQALGLHSLFNASDIALMGLSAIVRDLPRLMRRIGETARFVASEKPDCLVTIDSPDFSLRVAKKVRALAPSIPIVHYVCPSVWAWRESRAPAMKPYVDEILCILPFEPKALEALNGPKGTFVGHRLSTEPTIQAARERQAVPRDLSPDRVKNLLLLPGSRRSEVRHLIGPFGEAVSLLKARGHRLRLLLPTVPHVEQLVSEAVSGWEQKPEITTDLADKGRAFGEADAALIASGTVSLELALAGVPMISCYKLDPLMRMMQGLVKIWSASLPNLIADAPVVPEFYDRYARPNSMARHMEALFQDTELRAWQRQGFAEIRSRMQTDRPSGELAADVVLRHIAQ
ncbi:lipid-A-disaccharide synthase [Oryzicola mucosus]|uniref:Lipid-A-disaccharide synthase n=1 Tax=Oryzicola mucosus TaxID=2767425 RepID=A0A8J6U381_9HYPH|nr:lipid-A-disaccharide synthase [Oryzicola mucosus]MBD0416293.1 lipid-A-disaccharide synthase [Oryzicola mucosus]